MDIPGFSSRAPNLLRCPTFAQLVLRSPLVRRRDGALLSDMTRRRYLCSCDRDTIELLGAHSEGAASLSFLSAASSPPLAVVQPPNVTPSPDRSMYSLFRIEYISKSTNPLRSNS